MDQDSDSHLWLNETEDEPCQKRQSLNSGVGTQVCYRSQTLTQVDHCGTSEFK